MKAFIPAAGLGTRLQQATINTPKALVEVAGKPMIEWLMLKLVASGFDEVVINLHHFPQQIRDFFFARNNFGIRVEFSDESECLLDTGGGLWNASRFFNDGEPFLVHNADVLSDLDIGVFRDYHLKTGSLATLLVQERHSARLLRWDSDLRLAGWENLTTGEIKAVHGASEPVYRLAFNGIHMVDPAVFKVINKQGIFSVIDIYLELASRHRITAYPFDGKYWVDMGKPENIGRAAEIIKGIHKLHG